IFSQLTKKIEIPTKSKIGLISLVVAFGLIHVLDPFKSAIPNNIFFILLIFSFANIVMHFGSRIAIWFTLRTSEKKRDEPIFKMFDFITFYVVYVMNFVVQVWTLL